jgi:hypothetical protein
MNREILFRGKLDWYWDGINILYAEEAYKDGWVYGQLARNAHGMAWIMGHIVNWSEGHIYPKYWIPVDPKTVGQYTGIKIGGQKLFEHDVIRYRETSSDDWQYGAVVWCGDRDYPAFDVEPWIDCDCNGLSYIVAECEAEIIGNKWDDGDLLSGGDTHDW